MKIPGWIQNGWFLKVLVLLIVVGIPLGYAAPVVASGFTGRIDSRVTTAIITTLMAFTLDSGKLWQSFRAPGPVLLGFALNTFVVPLLGLALFPLQMHRDLQYGLLVACSVPCTLAAASVWTRKAGGNDAVSLLVTLTTSLVCFASTPFWLSVPQMWGGTTGVSAVLSPETRFKITQDLIVGAIVPTILGQVLRQVPRMKEFAVRHKGGIGSIAQVLILLMVLVAALNGGVKLTLTKDGLPPLGIAWVWCCCAGVHTIVLLLGKTLARGTGASVADQYAVAFAGSQKTLPTGVLIASELARSAGLAFAIFPMLMFHASQLFIDAVMTQVWHRRDEHRSGAKS